MVVAALHLSVHAQYCSRTMHFWAIMRPRPEVTMTFCNLVAIVYRTPTVKAQAGFTGASTQ